MSASVFELSDGERYGLEEFLENHNKCMGHGLHFIFSDVDGTESVSVRCECDSKLFNLTTYGADFHGQCCDYHSRA